ncbi:MAG: hypothetical protein FJW31_03655 [Acidobacteria bacterium]|nr:hypothetical protein [Acidobacteriota bacterium]
MRARIYFIHLPDDRGNRRAYRLVPSGLKDLSELRGKQLAFTTAGSLSEFALDMILESAGLNRNDVRGVALWQAESMVALAAGRLDGVVSVGSLEGVRMPEGIAVYPGLSRAQAGLTVTFVVFGPRLRTAGRAAGVRFLRTYLRGLKAFAV